jgi:addiction module HigA family antidote
MQQATSDYTLHDSGQRQEFSTGAHRDVQTGKGRFDLLPPGAIQRLARHFEKGATKYGDRNWEKGIPLSRFMDSALRHAFSYIAGNKDEDHLVAAAWNLIAALETEHRALEEQLPRELLDIGPHQHTNERLDYRPDYAVPPGRTLMETMNVLRINQRTLAARTGLSERHIKRILMGTTPITSHTAVRLEKATGISARTWNKLDAAYQQQKRRLQPTKQKEE